MGTEVFTNYKATHYEPNKLYSKKNVCLSTEIFRTYDKLFESY